MSKKSEKFFYGFLRTFSPLLLKKFGFETDVYKGKEKPILVLANHTTEKDFLMLSRAFPSQMYFVCGEHLCHKPIGKLGMATLKLIPFPRGGNSLPSVLEIMRKLKGGESVALFYEGCRSFDGITLPCDTPTAMLIKRAKCNVITYKISGGYPVAPRWAKSERRGKVSGRIINTYTPETISGMSVEEIKEKISSDLYENSDETQRREGYDYKGKNPAEGLENVLLVCPNCHGIDCIKTEGDGFYCPLCGRRGKYNQKSFLEGDFEYTAVSDFLRFSKDYLSDYIEKSVSDEPIFRFGGVRLYSIDDKNHKTADITRGELRLWKNYFEIGEKKISYNEITASSLLYYGNTMLFSTQNGYFGLSGESFRAIIMDLLIGKSKTKE